MQDLAHPLTRFSMQDYPEEGEGRMSQVHHGYKMLEGLPHEPAPPCVRVNREVFFVNELLRQTSREYFIAKKYFQAKLEVGSEAESSSSGHFVSVTEVRLFLRVSWRFGNIAAQMGLSVDPELIVAMVSTPARTFAEIETSPTEYGRGFTREFLNDKSPHL